MQPEIPQQVRDDIHITSATKADIPHIIALAARIWPVAYAGILTPQQIANMLEKIYSAENLREEMQQGHRFWLAYHDGNLVAYGSAYPDGNSICMKKLYIDSAMQGKGIGRQMIDIASKAWPAREIWLLVNPQNAPAHGFYERIGFTKTGTRPVQMGDWHFEDFIYSKAIS